MHTKVRTDDSFTKMRTKALEVGNIEYLGRVVFAGHFTAIKALFFRWVSSTTLFSSVYKRER